MKGTVRRLDGKPLERGPDGLIQGEPFSGLTPEQRKALPPLEPSQDEGSPVWALGSRYLQDAGGF